MLFRLAAVLAAVSLLASVAPSSARDARQAGGSAEADAKRAAAVNGAIAAFEADDFKTAIAASTEAFKLGRLRPAEKSQLYIIRGISYARTDDCKSAAPDLTEALAGAEGDNKLGVLQTRSYCLEKNGDIPGAVADIKAALALKPGDAGLLRSECVLFTNTKDWRNAAPSCASASQAKPDDKAMLLASAQAFEQSGDKAKASAAWSRLLAMDPADQRAKDGVARTK